MKKPVLVDAVEYRYGLEDGFDDLQSAIHAGLDVENYINPLNSDQIPFIRTLEGKHYINDGDFIITGVDGERYPCKKQIFYKTYTMIS